MPEQDQPLPPFGRVRALILDFDRLLTDNTMTVTSQAS